MMKRNAWIALILFALFLPSALMAQEMMHGKWWHSKAVTEELGLTDGERKTLDEKYTESRRRMIDLKSRVEKERFELDTLLEQKDADKNEVRERYRSLEQARTKLSEERFEMLMDVREVIGTERFQSLKQMHRKRSRSRTDRHFRSRSPEEGKE